MTTLTVQLDERGDTYGFIMIGSVRAVYEMNGRICILRTGNWGELNQAQWDSVERFVVDRLKASIVKIER